MIPIKENEYVHLGPCMHPFHVLNHARLYNPNNGCLWWCLLLKEGTWNLMMPKSSTTYVLSDGMHRWHLREPTRD